MESPRTSLRSLVNARTRREHCHDLYTWFITNAMRSYALDVIRECGEAWERLITGKTQPGGISTTNLSVTHSPSRVGSEQLPPLPPNEELNPEKIDSSIDKWFFISGAAA